MQENSMERISQYFPEGTTEQEIEDIYNDPKLYSKFLQELQMQYEEMQNNYSIYHECVMPVFQQSADTMSYLLLFCLVIRVLSFLKLHKISIHILSTIFGVASLWKFYESDMYYVLPALCLIFFVKVRKFTSGTNMLILTCIYTILGELSLDPIIWYKIKASSVLILMKLTSLCYDIQSNEISPDVTLIEVIGYVLNPASIIFGHFITMQDYQQVVLDNSFCFNWIFQVLRLFLLSAACLLWSSCGISYYLPMLSKYIPMLDENSWWTAYKNALSFRFSHYFVSYFCELCFILMGVGTLQIENNNGKKVHTADQKLKDNSSSQNTESKKVPEDDKVMHLVWSRPAVRMSWVELPGSLVDVVTNWNLPMHSFLKQYVFKSMRKYGVFQAILSTYIASSMLHGFNFQLSAVLLSIGIFAYIEGIFRHSLSQIFNACVQARKCRNNCNHKYKKDNFLVIAANIIFSFIAVWNLAYLGCPFDASEEQEQGYSMGHILKKWRSFDYINHIMMAGVFILQKMINDGRIF